MINFALVKQYEGAMQVIIICTNGGERFYTI